VLPVAAATVRLFLHVLAATVWVGGQLTLGLGYLEDDLDHGLVDVPSLGAQDCRVRPPLCG